MYIKKKRHAVLIAAAVALLSPSVHAASTITIYASPAVAGAVTDMVSDFTTQAADNAKSYKVVLQIISDADALTAIQAAGLTTDPTYGSGPDLILSGSTAVPNAIKTAGNLSLDNKVINYAKDSLGIYSSAARVAALNSVLTAGNVDNNKLLLSSLKVSIPDPAIDPYGLSAQKLLGGSSSSSFYSKLLKKGILVKTIDSVSAYGSVEFVEKVDGGTDLAFTGLSQFCYAPDGTKVFESGANQWIVPSLLGLDVQLAAITIANSKNQGGLTATYDPQELTDFVNFLTGTPLTTGASSGKDNLAAHCYH